MNEPTSFRLTEQSFNTLKDENIPDDILGKLRPLESQEFTDEKDLLTAVNKCIGGEETARYKTLILKQANKSEAVNEPPKAGSKPSSTGGTVWDFIMMLIDWIRHGGWPVLTVILLLIVILAGILVAGISLIIWSAEPGGEIVLSGDGFQYTKKSSRLPYIPSPSLISMTFEVAEYDPRLVDFRGISDESFVIPAMIGHELRFSDLWVSVPITKKPLPAPYHLQAKIYFNEVRKGNLIGETKKLLLKAGQTLKWDNVTIISQRTKPQKGIPSDSWDVKNDWRVVLLVLVVSDQDDKEVYRNVATFALNPSSISWLQDSPFVSFGPIIYTIDNGSPRIFDMRNGHVNGIEAQPGNLLTLQEIWYHSEVESTAFKLLVEAYLTQSGYNPSQVRSSPEGTIKKGINSLFTNNTSLRWPITSPKDRLVLRLIRNEGGIIADDLSIPLKSDGNPGFDISKNEPIWVKVTFPSDGASDVQNIIDADGVYRNKPRDREIWLYVYDIGAGRYDLVPVDLFDDNTWKAKRVPVGAETEDGNRYKIGIISIAIAESEQLQNRKHYDLSVLPKTAEKLNEITVYRKPIPTPTPTSTPTPIPRQTPSTKNMKKAPETILLYSEPSEHSKPIFPGIAGGDLVEILGKKGTWYNVKTSKGKTGWIQKEKVE